MGNMSETEFIERTLEVADPDVIQAVTRRIWNEFAEGYPLGNMSEAEFIERGGVVVPRYRVERDALGEIINRIRAEAELEPLS